MAISIGSAVGSGFSLIGRRPVSVISWGFFLYIAILILFIIGILIVGISVLSKFGTLTDPASDPTARAQAALGVLLSLWPALLIVAIGGLFINAMVQAAVFRSILTPDDRGFFSLRFGGQEFSLVLLNLLYIPIVLVVYLVTAVIFGGLIYLTSRMGDSAGWGVLLVVLFGIFYALAFMWFALKFSMAGPMTFAEGRVRFLGSWSLTKGEGWSLFGLAWIMVLVIMGVSIGYSIISGIVGMIFGGGSMALALSQMGASQDPSALIAQWPALLLGQIPGLIMSAAFQGLILAISAGPWADVYRQLRGSPDAAGAFS